MRVNRRTYLWARSKQGNRVLHVLEHASSDPTKPLHSVFKVSKDKVLGVVDEA